MIYNSWVGSKVRLRSIVATDWQEFHQNDQDSECARLCDAIYFPRSEDGTRAWAERTAAQVVEGDNIFLAIETLDGQLVGSITANNCDRRHGTFRYGIAIFRSEWRKGYAADAIRILLRYYFEELRYRKVNAHVYAFNDGSRALQEHLGFMQEGILREMIFTQGQHYDEYVYGQTKEEFEQHHSYKLS